MLRVASYNIHRGVGAHQRRDLERVVQVIQALNVDVLALQEVETPVDPAPLDATLVLLQRLSRLGYEALLGPTLRDASNAYGNLLLSRLPISADQRVDISVSGREPRGLIDAELVYQGHPVRVLATHLGLGLRERRLQVARLAAQIDLWQTRDPDCPLLLIGDFNHGRRMSRGLAPLRKRLACVPPRATFPARWPLLALDRIFYTQSLVLQEAGVASDALSRTASDHRPIWAQFYF